MIGIIVIGLLLIWVYRFAIQYQQNGGLWVVFTIIAYLIGNFGFQLVAQFNFSFLLDEEWERLAYPMFSGWFMVGIILLALRISARKKKNSDEDLTLDDV